MTKLISVIIPAFNAENTIKQTIQSIQNQTISDYEIIVVNDGSTDDTQRILQSLQSEMIKVINQDNAGVSAARNTGIKNATGRYISFLDADDTYEDDFLNAMCNMMQVNQADLCFTGYNIIQDDIKTPKSTIFKTDNLLVDYFHGTASIASTCWMIEKSLLQRHSIQFLDGVSWGEDIEFFSEVIAHAQKITSVEGYLVNYHVDTNDSKLSQFTLDKIDKDYNSVMRLVGSKQINTTQSIEDSLLLYRLPALLIYRMKTALDLGYDYEEVKRYYIKYKDSTKKIYWKNGLRSFKLYLTRYKLLKQMKYLEKGH